MRSPQWEAYLHDLKMVAFQPEGVLGRGRVNYADEIVHFLCVLVRKVASPITASNKGITISLCTSSRTALVKGYPQAYLKERGTTEETRVKHPMSP